MKIKAENWSLSLRKTRSKKTNKHQVFPLYSDEKGVFNNNVLENDKKQEDVFRIKESYDISKKNNKIDFNNGKSGHFLDFFPPQLSDVEKNAGIEYEENCNYLLGEIIIMI